MVIYPYRLYKMTMLSILRNFLGKIRDYFTVDLFQGIITYLYFDGSVKLRSIYFLFFFKTNSILKKIKLEIHVAELPYLL
ncbi:hypothetical protein GDO86_009726 [Hymenochirus boettgeri]|uniref:Uncharacterized protein n=1 Tax=Hymenochirus boettgeri TaxID=247094 RepID=A0A8T2JMJ9_9PIPI|nr:hypothetical protein GDO86_009726 [Hymenochirus boettgeri]